MTAFTAGKEPHPEEVRTQLHRMLHSRRFISAFMRAMLLRIVTERALNHEEIKEDIIAQLLYPNYLKDESNNVRVLAHLLRQSLDAYYRAEGRDDPILILLPIPDVKSGHRIPNGEAYRPSFAYRDTRGSSEPDHTLRSCSRPLENANAPEPFVSATQAAAFLSVSRNYVLMLARKGFRGAYRVGTGTKRETWIFRLSELANAVRENKVPNLQERLEDTENLVHPTG